ncbi:HAMP domain-containing protein [Granulicella sp. 5B5]|uniref:ATP-binding protein n=1 Tax=Granulicella sp. 5B5 TaxID=1617967 RepID=UPI0015F751D0|nr:ATP-binding protein [Granulicella sp. 5B5]QMV19770.1 HAMP domain-containing protein [Granulicella sp. 5B5]
MSSKTANLPTRSAAWRISLWGTLAFAAGAMLVFIALHQFMANDIQRRSDAWLSGEVQVLNDVAERTPKDRLYNRVVGEVAELASREVPDRSRSDAPENDAVFFLQTSREGLPLLWVGAGNVAPVLQAIHSSRAKPGVATDIHVAGFKFPFRVVSTSVNDGSRIYLGLSERDQHHVLRNLRLRFTLWWLAIVGFGALIIFLTTRKMLGHVRDITEAASKIGDSDLSRRVPTTGRRDEVGNLARTLNHMLDRIETSMHQLHTITDSLAHDMRSPLTAIRGKLEMSLSSGLHIEQADPIVSAIEELDRLCDFLDSSLDVAEAKANALRLSRTQVDLDEMLRAMIDLYEPSMTESGIRIRLRSSGPLFVSADAALLHRTVSNLLDNELKHLPASSTVQITLQQQGQEASLRVEDDGPGFSEEIRNRLFEQGVKSASSRGHGLGLAFVHAVVKAHAGSVEATNLVQGGARLSVLLPLAEQKVAHAPGPLLTSVSES